MENTHDETIAASIGIDGGKIVAIAPADRRDVGQALADLTRSDVERLAKTIRAAGIKPE